jgi:methylenetetrahydrofolate dehydrogenase (NADP+)/methenyltetrahydrofolate cyclohydrolase
VQTRIIDGNAIARELRAGLSKRAASLSANGVRPGLAVIRVGDHPASSVYVRNKIRACGEVAIHSQDIHLPDGADESTLLEQIRILNSDPRIHGILAAPFAP